MNISSIVDITSSVTLSNFTSNIKNTSFVAECYRIGKLVYLNIQLNCTAGTESGDNVGTVKINGLSFKGNNNQLITYNTGAAIIGRINNSTNIMTLRVTGGTMGGTSLVLTGLAFVN